MIKLKLLVIFIFSLLQNVLIFGKIVLKPHEQWWEKNLEHKLDHFTIWLGDVNADSRVKMKQYIKNKGYKSLLDIPCGLCTEYFSYLKDGIKIDYYGVDITENLVKRAESQHINVKQGSIENIPFADSSVEICYARHILEHLDYYKLAVNELIRVAAKEVSIIFFMKPTENKDIIDQAMVDGALLYHNHYNKTKLEDFIKANNKVDSFYWQDLNNNENVIHIYLK
jgi:ubiquinone/menaquinone biosynthesis C-methylase UbiE